MERRRRPWCIDSNRRCRTPGQLARDGFSRPGPGEGLGAGIEIADVVSDGVLQAGTDLKAPQRMRLRVIAEKKPSTAWIQYADLGARWKTQRGWPASHCWNFRCAQVAQWSRMAWITVPAWPARSTASRKRTYPLWACRGVHRPARLSESCRSFTILNAQHSSSEHSTSFIINRQPRQLRGGDALRRSWRRSVRQNTDSTLRLGSNVIPGWRRVRPWTGYAHCAPANANDCIMTQTALRVASRTS